jgi:hypothetical protein
MALVPIEDLARRGVLLGRPGRAVRSQIAAELLDFLARVDADRVRAAGGGERHGAEEQEQV